MKVSKIERSFVKTFAPIGKWRRIMMQKYGFKYTFGIIGLMIGFYVLAMTIHPDFTWASRGVFGFVIFGWVYDYVSGRVDRDWR